MIASDEYDWRQDEDPEVIADLQLRASSEHDSTRTREAVRPMGSKFITTWKCLMESCNVQMPVTEDAVFALDTCNAELERRGEPPIPPFGVCPAHAALLESKRAADQPDKQDRIAEMIRELKASDHPARETALIAKLRRSGHPDVDGLLSALQGTTKRKVRL